MIVEYWRLGSRPLDEGMGDLTQIQLKLLHLARFTTSRLALVLHEAWYQLTDDSDGINEITY